MLKAWIFATLQAKSKFLPLGLVKSSKKSKNLCQKKNWKKSKKPNSKPNFFQKTTYTKKMFIRLGWACPPWEDGRRILV